MSESVSRDLLAEQLRQRFPVENESHEWKAWRSLKHHATGQQGDDIVSYVSAISNMNGGALVVGVDDGLRQVRGIEDLHGYTPEKLKFRLVEACTYLPFEGLDVEAHITSDTNEQVWVIHIPRHAARQPVLAHGQPWQRVGDSLLKLRADRLQAILVEPLQADDWSAAVIAGASLEDLDPHALALAREQFARKFAGERWAAEVPKWADAHSSTRPSSTPTAA